MKSKLQLKSDIAKVRKATGNAELREALEQVLTGIVDSLGTGKVSISNIIGSSIGASGDLAELLQAFVRIFEYDKKEDAVKMLLPFKNFILGNKDKVVTDIMRSIDEMAIDMSQKENAEYLATLDVFLPTLGYLIKVFGSLFLSRTADDVAEGFIEFRKGIRALSVLVDTVVETSDLQINNAAVFGQFVTGIVGGSGGRIDKDGNAELESLVLRSFLEVPELRFNRIDVVSGELWNSIAFGTIASVTVSNDGKGGTAWVHLEKTERCGLKVGDICRGIFSDFGDGKPKDENEDENGFQKTYGFSTAYFTPTAIIRNEEGEFGFQYAIQAGTKVHPCAYMKFAVYGSFSDPSRRASAYFTRSYMRYLKNVQTWKINPDDNIASQFGNLDGLTIGGMAMKGEGTFLSNIYMTGAVIQFSPEQKKELMGQDAYSVVLSDYEAVLHVSVDGFVRDINKIREVVASNGDVMAMKDGVAVNVTDLGYNAATAVQVYKGKSMMHHAPIVGELAFTIVPVFYNCEGFIANGVLVVNRIVNPEENAYVDMEVNCEGFAVFTKHFAITVIKDASSPVVADLDNDMDTVVENPLTGDIIGSPLTTSARMHYGTDEMTIVSMSANLPLPNGIACEVDGSKATISVSKDAGAASAISFKVVGKTAVSDTLHTREVRFIANKVKSQYQLKLVPSVAEVKVDADGKFKGSESVSVKCQVLVNDGASSFIPDAYEALKGYRARMFYGVNVKSDVPDFANEVTDSIYADGVAVTSSDDSVTFWLYYYPNGINVASGRVRFDMETIHVLHDASDSFTQFVFKRVNADSVAAPKGGSYSSPLPDGWSDGVPAGSAKLWMSSRRFTSNGKNQDDAWSTPRPMTDTADFDVCFHDAVSGDAAPSAPPKDMHPTQTGMSGNNGWYDDGKTSSEWMAMATCSNGVWSDWSVVKIVGESPVIADIDNEMDGIGVGSDGILDVATSTSTNVCMYHGSRLMQIRSVSVSGLPSGVTASTAYPSSSDHSRCTVTFNISSGTDFSTKNRYAITLTIVATYNDVDYTRTLTYTLLGTTNGKDGEVYYLQPSTTAVKRNKDLVYSHSSVTCARYVKKGTSDALASTEGELTMSTDGGSTWDDYRTVSNFSGISSIIYRWKLNGVEVDRETVPVVIDGVGIKNVTKFYALSTSDEKVTGTWGTELPTMTSIDRYLWCYEKITYTDGSTQITDPIIIGVYGEEGKPGLQGLIVRTGEWVSGAYYRCDEGVDCGFLDVVLIKNDSAETGWDAYKCIKEHPSSSSNSPTSSSSSTYWQYMSNIGALFTSLIIAKNAKLMFAQANQLLLENDDATPKVTGGLSGGGGIQIWAGSDGMSGNTPNNPKFYVTSQGEMYAKNGVFEGSIKTKFTSGNDAVNFDKISGTANTIILPNGSGNVGREVTIYNSAFNQTRVPSETIIKVNGSGNIMGAKVKGDNSFGSVSDQSQYANQIHFWGGIVKLIALPNTSTTCLWMVMFVNVEGGYYIYADSSGSWVYQKDINDASSVNGLRLASGTTAGDNDNTIYFVTE